MTNLNAHEARIHYYVATASSPEAKHRAKLVHKSAAIAAAKDLLRAGLGRESATETVLADCPIVIDWGNGHRSTVAVVARPKADAIRARLESLGLSQAKLADKLGLTRQRVAQTIAGETWNRDTANVWARALEVEVTEISEFEAV